MSNQFNLTEDQINAVIRDSESAVKQAGYSSAKVDFKSVVAKAFYGINHQNVAHAFERHKERQGLTLFTRPNLNLSYNNIIVNRVMSNLAESDSRSMFRAIRTYLDPVGSYASSVVDNSQAFIPILTNTLESITPPGDFTLDTFTSEENMNKANTSHVDGGGYTRQVYDFECSFRNIPGMPVIHLFRYWTLYALCIYKGYMVKRPAEIAMRRVDYQTRVWRLKFDVTHRYVTSISCYNVAFPLSPAYGNDIGFDNDSVYTESMTDISIPFRGIGFDYNDPILYYEFNKTVTMFNPSMRDGVRDTMMQKLKNSELLAYNDQGYFRIADDGEFEVWVPKSTYKPID